MNDTEIRAAFVAPQGAPTPDGRSDTEPRVLHGQPVPEPPPERPSLQEAWDIRKPTVPLKVGWLQPDNISPAAVFLASDAANMITGAEYEVTGGDSAKNI